MKIAIIILICLFNIKSYGNTLKGLLATFDPPLDEKELPIISKKNDKGSYVLSLGSDVEIRGISCTNKMDLRISASSEYTAFVSTNREDENIYCLYDGQKASEVIINRKFQPIGANLFFSGYSFKFDKNNEHLERVKKQLKPFELDTKKYYLLDPGGKEFDLTFKILMRESIVFKGVQIHEGSVIYFNKVYIEGQDSNELYIDMIIPSKGKTITVSSQECNSVSLEEDFSLGSCELSKDLTTEGITIPKGSHVNFGKNDFGKIVPEQVTLLSKDVIIKGKKIKAGNGSWMIGPGELKVSEK